MGPVEVMFAVIAVLFAAVIGFALWAQKACAPILQKQWEPLAAVVSGTVRGRMMTGTFNGFPLSAQISGSGGDEDTTAYFCVTMSVPPAGKDWTIVHEGKGLLGTGERKWQVQSRDADLKLRLESGGALAPAAASPRFPRVQYEASEGQLSCVQEVPVIYALPSAVEFEFDLEMLLKLQRINERVNTG